MRKKRASRAKTNSGAKAAEALRVKKVLNLPKFFGSGLWQGDLAEMREERPRRRSKNRR